MTSIVRSTIVMALGLTLVLLGITGAASAQDTYAPTVPAAPQQPGPGPISNAPSQLSGAQAGFAGALYLSDEAQAFQTPLIAVPAGSGGGAGGVGGTGGAGGQLAFTGAETSVLAAGGMSLVLAGGVALIVSRRRD